MATSFVTSAPPIRAGEPDVFDLSLARGQWEKARSVSFSINGTLRNKTVYTVRPSPDTPDDESVFQVKQNKDCVLIHRTGTDLPTKRNTAEKPAALVTGANPKYAFQLQQTVGGREWVIDQVDVDGNGSALPLGFGLTQRQSVQLIVCDHYRVWDKSLTLERLFEKPNFRATKTQRVVVNGADMVRIDFECPHAVEKRREPDFSAVQSGYLILDPTHLWCLNEYNVRTDDGASRRTFSRKFDYTTGPDQFPILRAIRTDQLGYHPDGRDWFACTIEASCEFRHAPGEFEDREMTLSAFGLPEPYGVTWKRPTPTYLWLFAAAGVCAVVGVGLRYLARRKSASLA